MRKRMIPDLNHRRITAADKQLMKRKIIIFAGVFFIISALLFQPDRFTVFGWMVTVDFQDHTCLPGHRIFLVNTWNRTPARGELFAFVSRRTGFFSDGQLMLKKMSALPGDFVSVSSDSTLVNGSVAARGLGAAEHAGADPALFVRSFTVGAEEYFMVGESYLSLDSRYFGTVHEEDLLGRAYIVY